jgi:hypothetical protein
MKRTSAIGRAGAFSVVAVIAGIALAAIGLVAHGGADREAVATRPAGAARGGPCATCHESEAARASMNPGHRRCVDCHPSDPHAPRTEPRICGDCHRLQWDTSTHGDECFTCHDTHSGGRAPRAATCLTCHAEKRSRAHTTGSLADCRSCHRTHAPGGVEAPPPCATCHPSAELPGLHATAEHQECRRCHTPHESAARRDRHGCLSCHAAQTAHEPTAATCLECHPFRPAADR